jgi:glycosyltransferase involved in cell wall biosynthesis/polyhydroxyalkanoate synthesis regulator phasin
MKAPLPGPDQNGSGYSPPSFLSRLLPENIARAFNIAPLHLLEDAILVAAADSLSRTQRDALIKTLRRPVQFIEQTHTQVKRYQGRLYPNLPPGPGSPPIRPLLEALSVHHPKLDLAGLPEGASLSEVDPSDWLGRGWIDERQWGQLMGLGCYLPYLSNCSPSPINALPELISLDRRHYRTKAAFVPLWWARQALYVGISDPEVIGAVKDLMNDLGLPVQFLLIPPTLKSRLQGWVSGRNLFTNGVNDLQIAQRLLEKNLLSTQSLNAARTLQKTAGTPIQSALLERQPELAQAWLDAKAYLLDTFAVYEKELPKHFQDKLIPLFSKLAYPLCKLLKVLPLNDYDGTLIVGMTDPHPGALEILKQLSRSDVEARLMQPDVIDRWLEKSSESLGPARSFSMGIPDIRELILAMGLIQPDQLRRSESQEAQGIWEYLNRLLAEERLNEADMAGLLGILHQLPQLSLEQAQVNPDLIADFSQTFLNENHLLPLIRFDQTLLVALADPQDDRQLKAMEAATDLTIWPVLVPKTPLEVAISRHVNVLSMKQSTQYLNASINFLVERGLLTDDHRREIVRDVVQNGQLFDRAVEKYRQSSEQDIFQLFAEFRDVPLVSLKPVEETREVVDPIGNRIEQTRVHDPVDGSIARLIDFETAIRLRALPIEAVDDGVRVAFATPLYDQALRNLERILQTQVHPCITSREELENAIERVLGRTNIGTLLLNAGLITRGQLNDALNLAKNTGSRIGQALIHRGFVTENQLYSFLSKQANLPLFDLSYVNLCKDTADLLTPDEEWQQGVLPLSRDEETLVVGVIDPTNQDPVDFVKQKTGLKVKPVLITENDFENALERLHHEHYTARSISELLSREPENSAARVLTTPQVIVLIALLLISIGLSIWNFRNFLIAVNTIFTITYIMMIFYKFVLIANAIGADLEVPVSAEDIHSLKDDQLPVYTILIPVYKEASVLPKLLGAITRLDYPKIKLDVKVLLEEDDQETIQAFEKINPPEYIQGLIVPTSHPKTKPKACNYGLIRARGEFVVIYDAEDKPEPDQLKKVIAAFQKISPTVICIQSKLNYFNRQQNLLTQWFSSEYSMWFDLFLPGLDARNAPIPLGGTSNHFKKFALVEAGAWDPHNVTEDADLGIRLYKLGYRTRIVDTTTLEEANSQVNNWIRQRSRWVKGYIQTWLVHMRRPIRLIREIGFMAFFSFHVRAK